MTSPRPDAGGLAGSLGMSRLPLGALLLVLCFGANLGSAGADRGVAIDLGSIAIERDLAKGGRYTLPTIGVRNPGDEVTRYHMSVTYFQSQTERRPDAGWLEFSPADFELMPDQTQPVNIELQIPPGARPGDYAALLQARIVQDGDGVELGAAAGTRLSFTVEPSSFLEAWLLWLGEFLEDYWPLIVLVVGGVASAALYRWARRRFTFKVERR